MATLVKALQVSNTVHNVTKLFTNLSLTSNIITPPRHVFLHRTPILHCAFIHITPKRCDLMEFFEDPKHWGKNEVKVGRSWRKDELRLKSNSDLHKLWFVLLKERNMLMTMEEACKKAHQIFANPERLDKIQDSMNNLESIVRERNRAYHMLETGETGERPSQMSYNIIGMRFCYRLRQYAIPQFMNSSWHKKFMFGFNGHAVHKFRRFYREKLWNLKRRARNRDRNRVLTYMRRFPNLDLEAVKEQFPTVDVDAIKNSNKARGHYLPK